MRADEFYFILITSGAVAAYAAVTSMIRSFKARKRRKS